MDNTCANEFTGPEFAAAHSRSAVRHRSIARSIILNIFAGMPKGRLCLTLPEGTQLWYGTESGAHVAHLRILSEQFFSKCIRHGDIGFGEAYVEGEWETDDLPGVLSWFLLNLEHTVEISGAGNRLTTANIFKSLNRILHLARANTKSGSRRNIAEHYDLNNDFFATFLDPGMTYSSALFTEPGLSLEQAQEAKYDRLCKMVRLTANDHLLEIGTGWGGFAIHAASTYGCRVTTTTISKEQFALAQSRIAERGLENQVEVLLCDYRDLEGAYDKLVSIEMLEAVGHRYHQTYFRQCNRLLKKNGILALQVITCPDSRYEALRTGVDWIQKHIFPGTLLPSVGRLTEAAHRTGDLSLVDLKDMGLHYARTLHLWRMAFNERQDDVAGLGFDDTFIRKWNYYLAYCETAFAMRNINVMQLIYSRPNNPVW